MNDYEVIDEPLTDTVETETDCLRISYATSRGYVRETNEDSFFVDGKCRHVFGMEENDCYTVPADGTHVFGIFDGMGGEAHGELASELSATALENAFERLTQAEPDRYGELMDEFCQSANNAVLDMLKERGESRGGSTFAAVCVRDGAAYTFYLGDSRVYLRGAGSAFTMLTRDHTVAFSKLESGEYTEEQARTSRDRHALMHFIGEDKQRSGLNAAECGAVPFGAGSVLVMCTDGLTDMAADEEIAATLGKSRNPASALVELALANGGRDNVSCIVIENLTKTEKKP